MHTQTLNHWQHDHAFDQQHARLGERRTLIVIVITAIMMVVEIAAGIGYGSMALLADGLHMSSHAAALSITAIAYVYARRHAHDHRFSFGTGKINALAGFTSALLLAGFALLMAWESAQRFFNPIDIVFNQAIAVAFLGLAVNAASVAVLGGHHDDHNHDHSDHDHDHHPHGHAHGDHNLRAAYLHVLADALTSLLAIVALLAGKWFGLNWMDPMMGIVGALLVARWSWSLLRDTSRVLLDYQAPRPIHSAVIEAIESHDDNRITDLHIWSIGPNIYAALIALVTAAPKPPEHYVAMVPSHLGLVHATVEVHHCQH